MVKTKNVSDIRYQYDPVPVKKILTGYTVLAPQFGKIEQSGINPANVFAVSGRSLAVKTNYMILSVNSGV